MKSLLTVALAALSLSPGVASAAEKAHFAAARSPVPGAKHWIP